MGLFDFIKTKGERVMASDAPRPADQIKTHVVSRVPEAASLNVSFHDGVVTLAGAVSSAEVRETVILLAGNVRGVSEVSATYLSAPPPPADTKIEYYEIQAGDTLSAIAQRFLGNGAEYPAIFEANRAVIQDPDRIYPGQKIRIPIDG